MGCSVQHPTPVKKPYSLGKTSYKIASPPNTGERRVREREMVFPNHHGLADTSLLAECFLKTQGTERLVSKEACST